ncbi:MAG: hypothetical protein ACFNUH_07280 [Bacteroidota bacterium]|jgi:hypothetical protein
MKQVLIFLIILLGATIDVFSQRVVLETDVPTLEKETIANVRKQCGITDKTNLYATIVFEVVDTSKRYNGDAFFDTEETIKNYLNRVKIYHYRYEAFVYDDRLEHVYVRNRFLAWNIGRYKQKSDIVERENIFIAQFLLKRDYDFVYSISEKKFNYAIILLCFKNGLRDLAYLKDGQWYSTPVCGSDDFSFLKPLLEERLKEREIIRERLKK